jgi:SUMO ligase MMS21 Smc5/6 complex component
MKNVLLTLQPLSQGGGFKESHTWVLNNCPYALLLIGQPYIWRERTCKAHDLEGNPQVKIFDREQPCIVYLTEEELKNDLGTYQEYLPEECEENLFFYNAKLI